MACLSADFKILAQGEQTVIGEKGETLSGGQKARVALARCIYAKSDILLLDDPLSAVDSKVAKQIFQKCILPLSRTKTVILSTHQVSFLYDCDEVLVLEEGSIMQKGPPSEVARHLQELTEERKEE